MEVLRNDGMDNSVSNFVTCGKCGRLIQYEAKDTYWREDGYMYSAKLVDCKGCKTPNVLYYEEDSWITDNEC